MLDGRVKVIWRAAWPWLILASVAGFAVWHVLDFSEAIDTEFADVPRPFYNPLPPAAYRLAEPGDTLDRIGLYIAACASTIALVAVFGRLKGAKKDLADRPGATGSVLRPRAFDDHNSTRGRSTEPVAPLALDSGSRSESILALWPTALALALAATWHASTPSPTFDGWHGLGWRVIFDPSASTVVRLSMAAWAALLLGVIGINLAMAWPDRTRWIARGRDLRIRALLVAAIVLVLLRQAEIPGIEPVGFWPRCSFDVGILAFGLALIRARPQQGIQGKAMPRLVFATSWVVLVLAGVALTIYHRPLARLHAVVPGKIYLSAMPSYRGLAIEQDRLHFRTIINLFDEASTQASAYHDEEIRFVREHGLRYLGSPSDGLESDRFLDETLALAQNPDAWPILVHCHGCMDRSPAWMGIYRFVVEGKPLDEIFREIERHRGTRPKGVVTLQYNRKLPARAPERFEADPTAQQIKRSLLGVNDPFARPDWNPTATGKRVVTRIEPDPPVRRP